MNLAKLEFHEIANEFPLIGDEEMQQLAEDIKKHGLLEPLVLYQEKVLDGRNRYNACKRIGLKLSADDVVLFEEAYEGEDPVAFVISKNIARRHLTVGQRSAVAAELFKRLARKKTGPPSGSGSGSADPSSIDEVGKEIDQRYAQAASVAGVSATSVQRAVGVMNADPELHEEVKSAAKTLHQATQAVKRKKKKAKASLMGVDEAGQRILEVCGEKIFSAMIAKRMAGLRTGPERVALADRGASELKLLSGVMYWGELTITEALEFQKKRFGKPLTKKWKLEDLLAVMGMESEHTENFVTADREFAYQVTIKRFTPKAGAKS